MMQQAESKLRDFNAQEIANMLWALATVDWRPPETLIESLSQQAESKAREFKPQEMANTLWAAAVFGSVNAFLPLSQHLGGLSLTGPRSAEHCSQLHQYFLAAQHEAKARPEEQVA